MDKMLIAKYADVGIDILASILLVYILVRYLLKKRNLKKQTEEQESTLNTN